MSGISRKHRLQWFCFLLILLTGIGSAFATSYSTVKTDIADLQSDTRQLVDSWRLRRELLERLDASYQHVEQAEDFYLQSKRRQSRRSLHRAKRAIKGFSRLLRHAVKHHRLHSHLHNQISTSVAQALNQKARAILQALHDLKHERFGPNDPPIANAGPDQSVELGQAVFLDGSSSSDPEGQPLSYHWSAVDPAGNPVVLAGADTAGPTFFVVDAGEYVATLIVNDGELDSDPDTVVISTLNVAPVAEAGPERSGSVGDTVQFDGSNSSDADGDELTYNWSLVERPLESTAALGAPTSAAPSLTMDAPGEYLISLTVNDGQLDSVPDYTRSSTINSVPVADAGPDQAVPLMTTVQLDGSASNDLDGDLLQFRWSVLAAPEGSQTQFNDAAAVQPSLLLDVPGDYLIQLIVSDGVADSAPDTVSLATLNSRPVANAGEDQTTPVGTTVFLDGSGSVDADGDALTYAWSFTSVPEGSAAQLQDSLTSNPSFLLDLPGSYSAQLVVNDGELASAPDVATISTINSPPVSNAGSDLTIFVGTTAVLDGSGSYDVDNDALTYNWSLLGAPSGSAVQLVDAESVQAELLVDQAGTYLVQLIVNDGVIDSEPDSTILTVEMLPNRAPVIESEPLTNGRVNSLYLYQLQASDPDGDVLTFRLVQAPATMKIDPSGLVSWVPGVEGAETVEVIVTDSNGLADSQSFLISVAPGDGLPPNPEWVASENKSTELTSIGEQIKFIYQGDAPIQTGVDPAVFEVHRTSVLRGAVLSRDNAPLAGVRVTRLADTRYGETLSRADGQYDFVVNGGGSVVLEFSKLGYLPAQRRVEVPWNGYVSLDDIVLIPLDPSVASIDLADASVPYQVAQGSVSSDIDGTRQATVLFPAGTTATMVLADGSEQALTNISVRATEYTVGENGLESMPGPLPSASGYTYAVELSLDEAIAAGATRVDFSKKLPMYVDNFLNFPVGGVVPIGWYDRDRATWVAADNGRIIKLLNIVAGAAVIDVDGDGLSDTGTKLTSLGISAAELIEMAQRLVVGNSYWRVQIDHFTPWDCNWPYGPPADAANPPPDSPEPLDSDEKPDDEPECDGCTILAESQTLGEDVNIVGTPFSLHYRSDRVDGRKTGRVLSIPLSGESLPASLRRIDLQIAIAGARYEHSFSPSPNLSYEFLWDGKDAYGRAVTGSHEVEVTVEYVYDLVYYAARSDFQRAFGRLAVSSGGGTGGAVDRGASVIGVRGSQEVKTRRSWQTTLRSSLMPTNSLGGFSLNVVHGFDPVSNLLWRGDGSRRYARNALSQTVKLATPLSVSEWRHIEVDELGRIYEGGNSPWVRRINLDGSRSVVLDSSHGITGCIMDYTLDGSRGMYVLETGGCGAASARIHYFSFSTNTLTTLTSDFSSYDATDIALADDGNVYVTLEAAGKLGVLYPDGSTDIIGSVNYWPWGVDVGPDNAVYVSTTYGDDVDIFYPDGSSKQLNVPNAQAVTWDKDGRMFIAGMNYSSSRDGIYYFNQAGSPVRISGSPGTASVPFDGAPLSDVYFRPRNITYSEIHGGLLVPWNGRLWLVVLNEEFDRNAMEQGIPSEDGTEIYIFSAANGHHVATKDVITGATLFSFEYDTEGRLARVVDADNQATTITYQEGEVRIIAPEGQQTVVELDGNGWISRIQHPDLTTDQFTITPEGLLTQYLDARNNPRNYRYDALGRLEADDWPNGGGWILTRSELPEGSTVSMETGEGRSTNFTLIPQSDGSYERRITAADGSVTSTVESKTGLIVQTLANGTRIETQEVPDERFGRQAPVVSSQTTRLPSGLAHSYAYDRNIVFADATNPLSHTSITETYQTNGRVQTRAYDAATRTWTTTTPEGRVSTVTLDAKSRPVTVAVQGLEPATLSYDAKGRVDTITTGTGAEQRVSDFAYHGLDKGNQAGYLSGITDAESRDTGFAYDDAGRVIQQTLTDLRTIDFRYDANGNLIELTPPGKPQHAFIFDSMDDESHYIPPATIDILVPATQYSYDRDRKLTSIQRPDGRTATLQYHASKGQLETLSIPRGDYAYTYLPASGQLASVTAPDGGVLSFGYDGGLLKTTTWAGEISGGVQRRYNNDFVIDQRCLQGGAHCIDFGYDNDLLLIQAGAMSLTPEAQKAGLLSGSTLGTIASSYSYNGFGELTSAITSNEPLGDQLYNVTYQRDKLGRITQKTEIVEGVPHVYGYIYDLAGRLESVTMDGLVLESYGYDSNGNRIELDGVSIATYDEQDRMLTYGAYQYSYTENGELTERTDGVNTTRYHYDMLGNLVSVTLPNGDLVEYVIDGQNRRIGKKLNGAMVQGFLYKDQLNPIAELDGLGRVVRRFVYAGKGHVPAYMTEIDPDTQAVIGTYRIVSDHLGSPRLVVEVDTGAVMQRMDFDAWGNVLTDTNPGFQPFGFAGGVFDLDTKLVRLGARDYAPAQARWINKDPTGFKFFGLNLYVYLNNNPLNGIDISGEAQICGRPLNGFPGQFWKLHHSNIFYDNGRNSGFFDDDSIRPDDGHTRNEYECDSEHFDDQLMDRAEREVQRNWDMDWRMPFFGRWNNCQDYTEAVRERYYQLEGLDRIRPIGNVDVR